MNESINLRVFRDPHALRSVCPPSKKIVLVGGCFDLLHVGHVHVLGHAKALGEILVVAVLSDKYIQSYKGRGRPIIPEEQRARLVINLKPVDYVLVCDCSSGDHNLLAVVQPSVLVFGIEDDAFRHERRKQKEIEITTRFPKILVEYVQRHPNSSISTSSIISAVTDLGSIVAK